MATKFDYNKFFNYYTNPRNVTREPGNTQIQFYHDNTGQIKPGWLGKTSITVNNVKYYIKADFSKKKIRFTLPTSIPGYTGLWDFHYHFGVREITVNNKLSPLYDNDRDVIFFHKTIQEPQNSNKRHENCYFLPDELIDDITLFTPLPI